MPLGYMISVALIACCAMIAVRPPRPRRSSPSNLSFWFGYMVNELPFVALYWLVAGTLLAAIQGDLVTPGGIAAGALAVVTAVLLAVIVWRALRTRAIVDEALDKGLGSGWRTTVETTTRRRPWGRILLWPFPWLMRPGVRRIRNIAYGPDRRHHRLDVYRPRSGRAGGPLLIHLHGGAFRAGRKNLDAQPLINRLVGGHGWTCISANYRLTPRASFPDQLVDSKRVIAWARAHAADYGADPARLLVAGSSAGGHLAATAALTPNDPVFQPGFEDTDTSLAAAICLYPYPGAIATTGPPSSPHDYITTTAPPFLIAHGDQDTIVIVEDARAFARDLQATSTQPVVYIELGGAQHDFDLFHSIRFEAVIDAIETFATLTTTNH